MKKVKKPDSIEAPVKKTRPKRFNLKEELIENGWEKPKQSGFKAKVFKFLEIFLSVLGIGALIWLNLYRGFFNFSVEGITAIPALVLLVAAFALGEFMFYFMFLHGRHRKLSFLKETIPFKTIAYIVGGVTALISPIAAILVALIVPFMLNQAFANWVTRSNFDRRAEYYEPKYEEPETVQGPVQGPVQYAEPRQSKPFQVPKLKKPGKDKAPEATLSADLNGPQVSAIGQKEWGAHYAINSAALDKEYDETVISIGDFSGLSKSIKTFLDDQF